MGNCIAKTKALIICAVAKSRFSHNEALLFAIISFSVIFFHHIFLAFFVAILGLKHDVEAIHNLCKLLTAFDFFLQKYYRCICNCKLHFLGHHSYFTNDFEMLLAV